MEFNGGLISHIPKQTQKAVCELVSLVFFYLPAIKVPPTASLHPSQSFFFNIPCFNKLPIQHSHVEMDAC